MADLTDTSTAAQTITVGSAATITLALGTDTTGSESVTATALTDGQILTMTGSNDVTVAMGVADLSAATYVGVMTVSATTGTPVIATGTAADVITTGAGAASVTGGTGADGITLGSANGVADTIVFGLEAATTTFDTVTNAGTGDIIKFGGTDNGTGVFTTGAVAFNTSIAQTYTDCAAGDGSSNSAYKWFTTGGDAYLVIDNTAGATAATTDAIIKIAGVTDLSGATFSAANQTLTLV